MARKCPDCGHINNDELVFCEECGEPIDPKTRLMMELEGKKAPTSHSSVNKVVSASNEGNSRAHRRNDDDDDDYVPSHHVEEKKKSPIGPILGLIAAAVMAWLLFF